MDVSLDDIIRMKKQTGSGGGSSGKGHNNRGNSGGKSGLNGVKRTNFKQGQRQVVNLAPPPPPPPPSPAASSTAKILVSNLAASVSAEDVEELFRSEIGPLASFPVLHFDAAGRCLGSAEVTFKTRELATVAVQKFNGVQLDQQPMRIQLTMNEAGGIANRLGARKTGNGNSQNVSASGASGNGGNGGGGDGNGRGGNNKGRSFKRISMNQGSKNHGFKDRRKKSAEWDKSLPEAKDLDQEIDKYMQQHPGNNVMMSE